MCIRVSLIDRHSIVREGICSLLEQEPDIEVVAEVENGDKITAGSVADNTDILLIDTDFSKQNGIEVIRWYIKHFPGTRILVFSINIDVREIISTLHAGASGYLFKNCAYVELVGAIRTIYHGQMYLSQVIVDSIVKSYFHNSNYDEPILNDQLTNREREVVQLLAEGKNARDIAVYLSLSVDTVETYRRQIRQKLEIYNIADLTKYAIREGMTFLDV